MADKPSRTDASQPADVDAPPSANTDAPQADLSYEQARDELVAIVAKLEGGGTTLEESLKLWQRGEDLAALCERYLDNARSRLDAATKENS